MSMTFDHVRQEEMLRNTFRFSTLVFLFGFFVIAIMAASVAGEIPEENVGDKIPDNLVLLPESATPAHAIVVEKSSQTLTLFEFEKGHYQALMHFACSTGEVDGPKRRSGDKKTPEGVYFFTKFHEKKYLSAVYGDRAFPMDYPNLMDRRNGHKGNSIWLHGTNKPIKPRNSNGCIVLANSDINELSPYIELNRTPIIVVERLTFKHERNSAEIREKIMAFIEKWQTATSQGTYHSYLSYYDAEYLPDIGWWPDWLKVRKQWFDADQPFHFRFESPTIVTAGDTYVVLFDQVVASGDFERHIGTRKLFLTSHSNDLAIVGDTFQPANHEIVAGTASNPVVSACRQLRHVVDADIEIAGMVEDWIKAWSDKDMLRYASHYASDFRGDGMGRKAWLKRKRYLSRKYDFIRISKKNLVIEKGPDISEARFIQTYESDQYKAVGKKRLLLKREDGKWKIYREIWKKI